MKIPLDFFLIIMKKFLDEADLKDVSKILKKHLEISLDDYVRKININYNINIKK